MKVLCLLFILTIIQFNIGCYSKTEFGNVNNSIPNSTVNETPAQKLIADKDQLEIIKLILESINLNSKKMCDSKKTLYFSRSQLSLSVQKNFPEKLQECNIALIFDKEFGENFKDNYHSFLNWKVKEEFTYVTLMTNFYGGNTGAGTYQLSKKDNRWIIVSSEFSAAAS